MATHLALALHNTGHTLRQVLAREFDHADLLASRVGAQPINKSSLLDDKSDVYLLAVNDDALYDLALDLRLPNALVLHTSGSTPATVLKPISRRYGVVWSPQTFVRDIAMDYSRLPLCIEGSTPQVLQEIEDLFAPVTAHIHHLDFEQRRWAHLAAVMVSNFGNAINALAQEALEQHGIDFRAQDGLWPPLAAADRPRPSPRPEDPRHSATPPRRQPPAPPTLRPSHGNNSRKSLGLPRTS